MKSWLWAVLCWNCLSVGAWATNSILITGDGVNSISNSGVTVYASIFGSPDNLQSSWSSTETNRRNVIAIAGTLSKLSIQLSTNPGAGNTWEFTLMQNGTATNLDCVIGNTDTACQDVAHTITVAAGDGLSLRAISSKTLSGFIAKWNLNFASTTAAETPWMNSNTVAGNAVFNGINGVNNNEVTQADVKSIIAVPGTVKNLYVTLGAAPGAGTSRTITVQKGGISQTLACTVSDANTTCSDTSNSFSVVAGDWVTTTQTTSGAPSASTSGEGLDFVATTDGQFVTTAENDSGISGAGTTDYMPVNAQDYFKTTLESDVSQVTSLGTMQTIYAEVGTAPSAGNSDVFTLNVAGVASPLTCTIANTATTCNASVNASMGNGDLVSVKVTTTAGAASATRVRVGLSGIVGQRIRRMYLLN